MARDFGGEIRINLSTGQSLSLRGTLSEMLTGASRTVDRHYNGTVYSTVKLRPYSFEMTVGYDPEIDFDQLALARDFSLEVVKVTEGEIVNMSQCLMSGEWSLDDLTGEVSGLMIQTGVKPIRTPIQA
jgi:hypothetical protein